ncbi:hypothetical protein AY599_11485 [Leptolyngbya valderiana BDU 20041]|nr:hypothetical protein AY599_11485 [Leptolyngbya valderiana BDU 20041]
MPPAAPLHQLDGPGELPDARAITTRFARGDQDAFAVFYEATFDDALADARRLTGKDESFCLDAVQDAYVRAAKRLPTMDSWGACRSWLKTAIASSAVDRIRAEAARERREARYRSPGAHTQAESDFADLMARSIAQLDDRQWRALRLHMGAGLSLSAVGRAMDLSRHAANGLVRRGLATLTASMRAEPKGDTHD